MISRILIVGFGSIGKRHLRLARKLLPFAEIAVLRHKLGSDTPKGADKIFTNIEEALDFSPKLAVIANPAPFHISIAMRLAEIGVHLFIEKPISTTSEGVKDLIEICSAKNLVLVVGYNLRFLKSMQKFRSMLDSQAIGDVWSVRSEIGQYLPYWRPDSDYRDGVSAQSVLGGGALLELSHEIDYLNWIFGKVDWVEAILSKQSDLEIDVEDTAHLLLGFDNVGVEIPLIASLNIDFIRQDTTRLCTAIGKLGSLRWNGITGTVELWKSGEKAWQEIFKHQPSRDASYIAEWKNLISCIERDVKPLVTGLDGLKVLEIIEASRRSDKSKRRVKVCNANKF